jgi:hypothetical protein
MRKISSTRRLFLIVEMALFIIWPHTVANGKLSSIHVGEFFRSSFAWRKSLSSSPLVTYIGVFVNEKTSIHEEALSHPWSYFFHNLTSSGCSWEVSSIHVGQFSTQVYVTLPSFYLLDVISPPLGACTSTPPYPRCMHLELHEVHASLSMYWKILPYIWGRKFSVLGDSLVF